MDKSRDRELEHRRRIERLQQVRKQAKDIAHQRCAHYKENIRNEFRELAGELEASWSASMARRLDELDLELNRKAEVYGLSYAEASARMELIVSVLFVVFILCDFAKEYQTEQKALLRKKLMHESKAEQKRNKEAAAQVHAETFEALHHDISKRELRHSIHTIEQKRSQAIAKKGYIARETRAQLANAEPKSLPLQTLLISSSRKLGDNSTRYEKSQHHRATLDQTIRHPVNAVRVTTTKKTVTSHEAAVSEVRATELRLMEQQSARQNALGVAGARYKTAITETVMDKRKEHLCKELDGLWMEDRRRKHQNTSRAAGSKRVAFVNPSLGSIESQFFKQFAIDDEATFSNVKADSTARVAKTSLQSFRYDETPSLSIDFDFEAR
ncbi:hypothetical protein HDU67_005388 [Dinochytrium kinnereticum]|nr:hypothetical protein HDU67_005388 [Dinochytrium kinnereticum]